MRIRRFQAALVLALAATSLPLAVHAAEKAKKVRVAVLEVKAVGTFDPKSVAGLSSVFASEGGNYPYLKVISGSDVSSMIGFEKQKQLLGCTDTSCLAEAGGALGVDYLLAPEVAEVGGTWLLTTTLLDVRKSQPAKRIAKRAKSTAGLVDMATESATELFRFLNPVPVADSQPLEGEKAATPTLKATASSSSSKTLGWIVGGGGVALLAGGALVGLAGHSKFKDEAQLVAASGKPSTQVDSIKTMFWAADGLYAAGAIATGIGIFLLATAPPEGASVSLVPLHSGAVVMAQGSF